MKTKALPIKQLVVLLMICFLLLPAISVIAQKSSISISVSKKSYNGSDESCFGSNDAELTIVADGGSGNYQYSIDKGKNYTENNVFSNLKTNKNYEVLVKDNLGNKSDVKMVWVGKISNPVTFNTTNVTNATCATAHDGVIEVGAHGGTGQILFSIDNGDSYQSGNSFTGLAKGNYSIIAKDVNGCTAVRNVSVGAGPDVSVSVYYQQDYNCGGWGKGTINFGGNGGKWDFDYFIDGVASSNNVSGLSVGQHTLKVVDVSGCSATKDITIKAPYTAILSGDTTVRPNTNASLKINIEDPSGSGSTLYKVTYKNNQGTIFTKTNLKKGENSISVTVSEEVTYSLLTVEKTSCEGYAGGKAVIKVSDENVWLGVNSNWNNSNNWSLGSVPTSESKVRIPVTENNPIISGIASSKSISISMNAGLQIAGILNLGEAINAMENNVVDATTGSINYCGTSPQTIESAMFKDYGIKNITISNSVTLADSLNVFGLILFNGTNNIFTTNDHLTLKSTPDGTASVGKMVDGNRITGKVVVEQYFPAKKGWKFLSVSTQPNQTIHEAWQEGQPTGNTTGIRGFGIQLTGTPADWASQGFDAKSPAPAIKTYNSATNLWVGMNSTRVPFNQPSNAYMTFVRGDRSANAVNSPETPTILRSKGELKYGDQPVVTVPAGQFVAIGNPYPSDIDMSKINTSDEMFFYVWDPNLGNSYGAYQTFIKTGKDQFTAIPGGGSYTTLSQNIIPAGQAFFVFNANGGTVQLTENCKAMSNANPGNTRSMSVEKYLNSDRLIINLYSVTGGQEKLVDGVLQNFSAEFTNDLNGYDALKSVNTGENLSIKRGGKLLAIESKAFNRNADTTVLNFTGMSFTTYRFKVEMNQVGENYDAVLLDKFTGKRTVIRNSEVSEYEFQIINNASSYAPNRFEILFVQRVAMPVAFTSVKAEKKNEVVAISWSVENEMNVASFEIERSADGLKFNSIGSVRANKVSNYTFMDHHSNAGVNYYRVVSVDIDGRRNYSSIVKVVMDVAVESISVYPNPVVGNSINLRIKQSDKGIYYLSIKNQLGQQIYSEQISYDGSYSKFVLNPVQRLSEGVYTIDISHPTGAHSTVRFVK